MVSVPVRLHKAARRERMTFHHVYRPAVDEDDGPPEPADDEVSSHIRQFPKPARELERDDATPDVETVSRVRNAPVGDGSDSPVAKHSILKGFETEKDQYVVFAPREIAAPSHDFHHLEILEFVRLEEIDPMQYRVRGHSHAPHQRECRRFTKCWFLKIRCDTRSAAVINGRLFEFLFWSDWISSISLPVATRL
jgi:hypothetical protein